ASLIARRFDPEDQHGMGVRPSVLAAFIYNSTRSKSARELDADRTREGKRAFRSGDAQVQAHRGEDRAADRVACPRILREADFRKKAQARCGRQAPSQAPAQPDAAGKAVLIT